MAPRPVWMGKGRKDSMDFRNQSTLVDPNGSSSVSASAVGVGGLPHSAPGSARARWGGRRSFLFVLVLGAIVLVAVQFRDMEAPDTFSWSSSPNDLPQLPLKNAEAAIGKWHPSRFVKGPPTEYFKDNLLDDAQYITGFIGGGHTNDFMTYINLIYIGWLTRRIPILPPFAPTHIGYEVEMLPFGDVYDVERLAEEIGIGVVEWKDVKLNPREGGKMEPLGGWSVWARYDTLRKNQPREGHVAQRLGLDPSYTIAPARIKMNKEESWDLHVSITELAALSSPSWRRRALEGVWPFASEGPLKTKVWPDEKVLTFDFLYYAAQLHSYEWEFEYFAPWRMASHAHWTPRMLELVHGYLVRMFGVDSVAEIPKYIVIHQRHGDFSSQCPKLEDKKTPKPDCFATVEDIDVRVQEIQAELGQRPEFQDAEGHPVALPVVMTSDERDPQWWKPVFEKGWLTVDHGPSGENTAAKLGKWYPLIIDAAIQSLGHGFIGSKGSTMSIVAARRVEDWQRGATRMVAWGKAGADKHETQNATFRAHIDNRFW